MKKTLLFAIIMIAFTMNVNAQFDVLIDEDFNGTTAPSLWGAYNLGDTACDTENWTYGSEVVPPSSITTNNFPTNAAIFDDYSYGGDGNHNYSALYYGVGVNPLDLSSYDGALILSYDYTLYQNNNEVLQVGIWDNANTTWIVVKTYDTTTVDDNGNAIIKRDYLNLRDAINTNAGVDPSQIYFGFLFDDINGSQGYGAGIDNVKLEAYTYAQPDNDICDDAQDISAELYNAGSFSANIDARGATNNDGFIATCYDGTDDGMNDGVWFTFYSLTEAEVTIDVTPDANFDPQIGVFSTSTNCSDLTCVGTMDQGLDYGVPETITINVDADVVYYINIGDWHQSFNQPEGTFDLDVTFNCTGSTPANDVIANATEITTTSFSDTVDIPCSQNITSDFISCPFDGLKGVFYKFEAAQPSTVTATINNTTNISAIVFYEAPSLNATEADLTRVDQTTNPCSLGASSSIQTEAGKYYYVVVTNGLNATQINIDGVQAVGISSQTIEGVNLYPNPVNDILSITAPNNIEEINIYNIAGQLVYHATPAMEQNQINTADWAKGTYVVKIYVANQTGVYHIVKK